MRSRRPGLADSLPESFPDLHIVQLYLNPIISSHKTLSELVLECRLPNVTDITRLCELHFNWGNRQDIQSKFATSVVPSILTFILAQDALHRLKLHSATNNDLGHSQVVPKPIDKTSKLTLPLASISVPSVAHSFPECYYNDGQTEKSKRHFTTQDLGICGVYTSNCSHLIVRVARCFKHDSHYKPRRLRFQHHQPHSGCCYNEHPNHFTRGVATADRPASTITISLTRVYTALIHCSRCQCV